MYNSLASKCIIAVASKRIVAVASKCIVAVDRSARHFVECQRAIIDRH